MDNQLAQDQKVSFFLLKDMDGYESQILQETGYELESEGLDDLTQTFLGELESDVVVGNGKRHFIKGFNLLSKGKFEDIQFVVATELWPTVFALRKNVSIPRYYPILSDDTPRIHSRNGRFPSGES